MILIKDTPRLIPLRVKERISQAAGRAIFDLSYYLQFQPSSLEYTGIQVKLRPQRTAAGTRRRIAMVTPHLGPGGAERVLLDIAQSVDRSNTEIFLVATHSRDSRWAAIWKQHVDHVHDLAATHEFSDIPSALYSLIVNHGITDVLVQNTLFGYMALPQLRKELPLVRIVDLIHAVKGEWDLASATACVAANIDTRVVISETARRHLACLGVRRDRTRLIPNGVDLIRFHPAPTPNDGVFRILFAARLDPVKRPLMLPLIAANLQRIQPARPFQFIIAGDGPESEALRENVERMGLQELFDFRGFVEDMAPVMAESDLLLVTSSHEGIPLAILEAFASGRPVVASRAGAIAEVLDPTTGILVLNGNKPHAFANALSMLMADENRRKQMGVAARQRAELYHDRQRSCELYRELWNGI